MDYKKLGENIITWAIPLAVAGILGFLQVYGKDFLTPILLIGLAILLVFLIIYFAVHFLAIREKRWQDNYDGIETSFNFSDSTDEPPDQVASKLVP